MQTKILYRYTRPNGGTTVSPVQPEGEYTEIYRLIADEGMALTDGATFTPSVDTETPEDWTEIFAPETDWDILQAPVIDPDEATEADYLSALAELGVTIDEES